MIERIQRWWLLVKDVNGTVIHNEGFFLRRNAEKTGRQITTPPLNTYEIREGWR